MRSFEPDHPKYEAIHGTVRGVRGLNLEDVCVDKLTETLGAIYGNDGK